MPGGSKGCCLEVFKYLRASKKHSFVTPGEVSCLLGSRSCFLAEESKSPEEIAAALKALGRRLRWCFHFEKNGSLCSVFLYQKKHVPKNISSKMTAFQLTLYYVFCFFSNRLQSTN